MARETGRSTLAGIAAEAGVSVSAVSKVLNGRTDVAAATRARVAALLRRDGYQVASRLGFGVVDLLIATLHTPWAEELLRGTVQAADEAGASVVVSTVDSPGGFTAWLNRATARGTDGALTGPAPAGQQRAAGAGRRAHPAGGDRPAGGTRPGHPVGGHHELAGLPDRDPAPDRAGAPPHRHHRRPGAPVVQPGPAGRLPRRPGGGRADRGRGAHPPGPLLHGRRPAPGPRAARAGRSRPPRSWPATIRRRSACSRPSASGGCGPPTISAWWASTTSRWPHGPLPRSPPSASPSRPWPRPPSGCCTPGPVQVNRITSSWPPPWSSGKAPARRPGLYKRHLG